MADILASLAVRLGADTAEFDRSMAAARKQLAGFAKVGERFQDIGKSLSIGVSAPLLAGGLAAVSMAGDMEKAQVAFETMLGSAGKANQVIGELKDLAAATPFEFPELQDAGRKLLAFGTPAKDLKNTLRQLGDIAAGVDAPIGDIAEIYGKARVQGRLFAEDINQLTGRGIPIIQELAKQFGVTDGEVRGLVESGKVGFPQIEKAFSNLTAEGSKFGGLMAKQSATLPGLVSTLFDTVKEGGRTLGADLIKTFDLKGLLSRFTAFADRAVKGFQSLSPEVKKIGLTLAAVAVGVGPLLFALGSIGAAIPVIAGGLGALGLAAGPVVLAVGAVAVAAGLLIANWTEVVDFFTSGPASEVFSTLAAQARGAFDGITRLVKESTRSWRNDLSQVGDGLQVGGFVTEFAQQFGGLVETVRGVIAILNGINEGDWALVFSGFSKTVDGATQEIRRTFEGIKIDVVNGIAAMSDALGASSFAKDLRAYAVSLGLMASTIGAVAAPMQQSLVVTKDASAQLTRAFLLGNEVARDYAAGVLTLSEAQQLQAKIAKDAADEQAAAATKAAAATLSEDQKKALAALAENLRENARLSTALGSRYDYVGERGKVLESAVKSLVSVGFDPAGRTIKGLVSQLNSLATAYDQIAPKLAKGVAAPKVEQQVAFAVDFGKVPTKLPAVDTSAFVQSLQPAVEAGFIFTDQMAEFNRRAGDAVDQMNQAIQGGLADAAGSMAEGIGNVLAGAAPIEALGGILLGTVGDILVQLGRLAIASAITVEAIKKAFANPATALVAGAAAIALGTFIKAKAGSILSGGSGGGGGGGGMTMPSAPSVSSYRAPNNAGRTSPPPALARESKITHVVEVVQRGADMVGVLEIATDRLGRLKG